MIVVKMSPKGLIPCGQIQKRQIHLQSTLSKLSIIPLLSKNRNRDTLAFRSKKSLDDVAEHSSKNHIIITQKQTQIHQSTHKLHSLHPHI